MHWRKIHKINWRDLVVFADYNDYAAFGGRIIYGNNMRVAKLFTLLLTLFGLALTGCEVMPVVRYKPTLHNPFVQMRSVAVVPFENLTGNDRVSGIEFADQFALELQRVPGFRVIANKTVRDTMWEHELHKFESVDDIRYLAQLLGVDVVVIGRIHHFSMSHAPLTKFETAWYHVNPYLQPMLEGYTLPWGTEFERYIPDRIVMLAEMNLAEAQIRTQTPEFEPVRRNNSAGTPAEEFGTFQPLTPPGLARREQPIRQMSATIPNNMRMQSTNEDDFYDATEHRQDLALSRALAGTGVPFVPETRPHSSREQRDYSVRHRLDHPLNHGPWQSETAQENQLPWSMQNPHPLMMQNTFNPGGFVGHYPGFPVPAEMPAGQLTEFGWVAAPIMPVQPIPGQSMWALMPGMPVEGHHGMVMGEPDRFPGLPHDWPDPRGFIPEGPRPERPVGTVRNEGPIISLVQVYKSNDTDFMQALEDYDLLFRDDKRLSGKRTILTNRSEFIAFCCRMHIWEIFSARGGAGPAQRVTRAWKPWMGGVRPY